MPTARPHDQRRDLGIEPVLLSLRAREVERPLDGIDEVHLALDEIRPRRCVGILEVGHEHLCSRVQRVDDHLAVGRSRDLDTPVLKIIGGRGHLPIGLANRSGCGEESWRFAGVEARLALVAHAQQLEPPGTELALQAGHELERVTREHLGGAPGDRPLQLHLFTRGHRPPIYRTASGARQTRDHRSEGLGCLARHDDV